MILGVQIKPGRVFNRIKEGYNIQTGNIKPGRVFNRIKEGYNIQTDNIKPGRVFNRIKEGYNNKTGNRSSIKVTVNANFFMKHKQTKKFFSFISFSFLLINKKDWREKKRKDSTIMYAC